MDSNCGRCKHWGEESDETPFRECTRIKFDEVRESEHGKSPYVEDEETTAFDELAVTVDGHGWHAELRTRAAFGCVLFEAVGE